MVDLDDAEVTYWGDLSELADVYAPVGWCGSSEALLVLQVKGRRGRLGKHPGTHPALYFPALLFQANK